MWERLSLGIAPVSTNPSKLANLFSPTTPVAADACISALLSLAVVKSRGPLPAGGTDCSTLRSTIGLNGASFWAKRAEREGEPAGRWQKRKQQRVATPVLVEARRVYRLRARQA